MENQVLASKTANSSHHVSPLPSRSRSGSAGGGNSGGDVGGRGLYTRSTTGEENLALVPSSSRQLHGKATTQDTANLPPPALETMFEDDIQDERRSPTVGTDAGSVTTGDPGPGDVAEQEVASAIAKAEQTSAESDGFQRLLNPESDAPPPDGAAGVAELYLALDSLLPSRKHTRGMDYSIDPHACAEFGATWTREVLPGFVEPALLEPVWLVAKEV